MEGCFKVGLYKQGLLHDLSKFNPEEFMTGVRFFQGTRSPNAKERELYDYSVAWLHHKGRNKHHFESWTDVAADRSKALEGKKMPVNYLAEMVMDRIAASKTYKGDKYTDSTALEYLDRSMDKDMMHPDTYAELRKILTILSEDGEKVMYAYVRRLLRKGTY